MPTVLLHCVWMKALLMPLLWLNDEVSDPAWPLSLLSLVPLSSIFPFWSEGGVLPEVSSDTSELIEFIEVVRVVQEETKVASWRCWDWCACNIPSVVCGMGK